MAKNSWLWIAAIGLGAYFLLKGKGTSAESTTPISSGSVNDRISGEIQAQVAKLAFDNTKDAKKARVPSPPVTPSKVYSDSSLSALTGNKPLTQSQITQATSEVMTATKSAISSAYAAQGVKVTYKSTRDSVTPNLAKTLDKIHGAGNW